MKKKKLMIISSCVLAVLLLAVGLFLILNKPQKQGKDSSKKHENEVVMYVKINPLVKLVYKEVYQECTGDDGKTYYCSFITEPIKDFELINNDAKDIYDKLDFKGKELFDVLTELCDTARENHVGFKSLEISSNSKMINPEIIKEEVTKNSKYETTYEVLVDFQEYVDEEKTIKDLEENANDKQTAYTVTFDSDGGSLVKQQSIIKNDLVGRPSNPTKEGFVFVEWLLDGKPFNFTKKVTSDLTLKAKWDTKKADEPAINPTEQEKPTESNTQVKKYTIKFDSNGGTKVNNQTVEENKTVTKPTNPTKKYNELVEWQLNGKTYDFSTPVTSNITLKAVWKEVAPTLEKINLNDNILIYESGYGTGNGGCGSSEDYYLSFFNNLSTLFPGKSNPYNYYYYVEEELYAAAVESEGEQRVIKLSDWEAKKSQLTYDTAKENNMINVFKSIQSDTKPGMTKLQYNFENHSLNAASYGYITLVEPKKFPMLDEYISYITKKQNDKFDAATKGLINITPYGGGCGDMPSEELLDEEMCSTYNLPCGRW